MSCMEFEGSSAIFQHLHFSKKLSYDLNFRSGTSNKTTCSCFVIISFTSTGQEYQYEIKASLSFDQLLQEGILLARVLRESFFIFVTDKK